jgi:hypothetical protein
MWTCLNCTEKLEDSSDSCWRCGTGKDAGPPDSIERFRNDPWTLLWLKRPVLSSVLGFSLAFTLVSVLDDVFRVFGLPSHINVTLFQRYWIAVVAAIVAHFQQRRTLKKVKAQEDAQDSNKAASL